MKKTLIASVLLSAGLAFAGSANAYMVGSTDVGDADQLKYWTTNLSGEADELAWIQGLLGADYNYVKTDNNAGWVDTDVSGVVAKDLGMADDDYFFIKTGAEGTADSFLYKNLASTSWAVVDLNYLKTTFGLKGDLTVTKISHWGDVSQVPLPGAAWLFGSALLGFMAVANRRRV